MARAPALQEQETFPEADRLEGFPHPRLASHVYGHEQQETALAEAFSSSTMHHAWLLTGPQGIGKATLAYKFAKYALSPPQEREHHDGRLGLSSAGRDQHGVEALSHARLLVIRREWDIKTKRFSAQIRVDDVRRLKKFLSHRSDDGQWRVVIVDAADELNISAANALLKSLEEPPPETVFLLISSEPGRLLKTIHSRCRRLELRPLDDDALALASRQAIAHADGDADIKLSEQGISALTAVAGGSVRRLLALAAGGGAELKEHVWRLLSSLPKTDWARGHQLADTLSPTAASDRFELFFNLLLDQIARLVRAKATGLAADAEKELAARLIREGQLASWAALWETVAREKADVQALNLDRKTLILSTLARLEAAAQ